MGTKRKKITLSEKLNVIREVEANPMASRVEMANRLGLAPSSLCKIISRKSKIIEEEMKCGANSKKRMNIRTGANEELEKVLMEWFQQMRLENVSISGPILREKATEIALCLKIDHFKASNGWFHRFKKRHDVTCRVICGESGAVSEESVHHWINNTLPTLIQGYETRNIFNADETALFYSLLPNRTFNIKGETCKGGKKSKERLTVLLCCNADGTEKLKPLIIGKYAKPKCFRKVKAFPCHYANNTSAWMTTSIFLDFLRQFDARMGSSNRKVLLFVDKCPAHPSETLFLKNIKVIFLPANCTSKLQPLDVGIIHSMKAKYRKLLVQKAIAAIERKAALKLNVLQAMHMMVSSWYSVSAATISNCFRKAGFFKAIHEDEEIDTDENEDEVGEEDWKTVTCNKDIEFSDFVHCDNDVFTSSVLTVEEMCNAVEEGSESESEVEDEIVVPTFGEAVTGFEAVRRYMCFFKLEDASLSRLNHLEKELHFLRHTRPTKQNSLLG